MKGWLTALHPNRIGGQILLLVAIAAILTQTLNFAVMLTSDTGRRDEGQLRTSISTFVSGVHMIAATEPAQWQTVVDIVRKTEPDIAFAVQAQGVWPPFGTVPAARAGFLERDLGAYYALRELDTPAAETEGLRRVLVRTSNGAIVSGSLILPALPQRPPVPGWSLFIFAVVFLPLVFIWAAWSLSRQLNKFARAAEDFSLGGDHQMLEETGPHEIRQAARALNRMRDRIAGLIADRKGMLTAVSHDLRTPITRLRLRAEFIEDEHTRLDILKDLDRMSRMVNSALTYIRDGRDIEQPIAIDLPPLLRTVGDNFIDVGEQVSYEGEEHLSVVARPDALVRAVENLIENGLKYGHEVVVRTGRAADNQVFIEVEDDGTGISEDRREAMLQPFVRGDAARTDPSTGFGLGLSITASIAKSHGGQLLLTSGKMGGLLARLLLPGGGASPSIPVG